MELVIAILLALGAWAMFFLGAPFLVYAPLALFGCIWMAFYVAPLWVPETTEVDRAVADWSKERWTK
jgi:hypothetical protein